jgi:hypothetical protein
MQFSKVLKCGIVSNAENMYFLVYCVGRHSLPSILEFVCKDQKYKYGDLDRQSPIHVVGYLLPVVVRYG